MAPRVWRWAPGPCPDPAFYEDAIVELQTPDFVRAIESSVFLVDVTLGEFSDGGGYFLWLEGELPTITPVESLAGTCFDGCPFHVSLGHPAWELTEREIETLEGLVSGLYVLRLIKWTGRREASTYLPGGPLAALCSRLAEQFGFAPRGEWHISL